MIERLTIERANVFDSVAVADHHSQELHGNVDQAMEGVIVGDETNRVQMTMNSRGGGFYFRRCLNCGRSGWSRLLPTNIQGDGQAVFAGAVREFGMRGAGAGVRVGVNGVSGFWLPFTLNGEDARLEFDDCASASGDGLGAGDGLLEFGLFGKRGEVLDQESSTGGDDFGRWCREGRTGR